MKKLPSWYKEGSELYRLVLDSLTKACVRQEMKTGNGLSCIGWLMIMMITVLGL